MHKTQQPNEYWTCLKFLYLTVAIIPQLWKKKKLKGTTLKHEIKHFMKNQQIWNFQQTHNKTKCNIKEIENKTNVKDANHCIAVKKTATMVRFLATTSSKIWVFSLIIFAFSFITHVIKEKKKIYTYLNSFLLFIFFFFLLLVFV